MNLDRIPSETTIFPMARSRFKEGGPDAVLLIHGFTSSPDEFDYLFGRLTEAGFTVSAPRLPGHGTNARDFHESTGEDWLRRAMDEYLMLKTHYSSVSVAGLSMGALIALILAETFDPRKLALLAPAISIRKKDAYFSPLLKYIIPSVPGSWKEEDEEDPEKIAMGREYWLRTDTAKVADLIGLRKQALKNLARVASPTLTIVSEGDKTVSPNAVNIVEEKISSNVKEHLILKNSGHVIVNDCEKETVADRLIEWLN